MVVKLEASPASGADAVTLTLPSERPDGPGGSGRAAWMRGAEEIVCGRDTGGAGAGGASARAGVAVAATALLEVEAGWDEFRGEGETDRDDEADELFMVSKQRDWKDREGHASWKLHGDEKMIYW